MNRKVSIIIPTYNYGRYIERAVDSALGQTYPNIEVIVVDDGSTDDTEARLRRYRSDARVVLLSQPNRGAAAARNTGIRAASGAFVAFLDADDRYMPDNIAKKVAFLEANSDRFPWCYSDCVYVKEQSNQIRYGHECKNLLVGLKASGNVLPLALQGYQLGTNLPLFRREVLEAVGGFDERLIVLEDFDLYLRAAALFPIGYVDDVLIEIYQHEGSLGSGGSKKKAYYSRWLVHRKIVRAYAKRLRLPQIAAAWARQQADLYRNLAELALLQGNAGRASILARAAITQRLWQPGILRLCWRIAQSRYKQCRSWI